MRLPPTGTHHNTEQLGIILKILSVICFSAMSGVIKYVGGDIPLGQVVFFRSFVALVPLIIFLLMTSDFPQGLKTNHPVKHVMRCLFGIIAMFFAFATLRYLPIAEATAITYLSPVILVILAITILKEKVSSRRVWGVILGVSGLACLTVPEFSSHADSGSLIGIGLAVTSAFLIALALLQVRQLSQMGENPATIAFYFALTSTIASGAVTLFDWQTPTLPLLISLIVIGLLGGIAQIMMTLAFSYAEASAMAPYDYLSIIWAVIIGMVFFSESPTLIFWVAAPLILAGAIIARPASQKNHSKKP